MNQNQRQQDDGARQIVATVLGRKVTRAKLTEAFNLVAPKDGWKNPINAEVVIDSDLRMLLIREAVIFFTGSVPTFDFSRSVRPIKGTDGGAAIYRVRAAGYYATIGA
jgi:hypothetical protein